MWATYPRLVSSGYHADFHEGCYQKHTTPLNRRASSSDISRYHADFHEGHGTVGRMAGARHGMCELTRKGKARGTAWTRYGMCELPFTG
jgi:hypothetical protein